MSSNERQRHIEAEQVAEPKARRDDIEEEDMLESFLKFREEKKQVVRPGQQLVQKIEYDADDNPIMTQELREGIQRFKIFQFKY